MLRPPPIATLTLLDTVNTGLAAHQAILVRASQLVPHLDFLRFHTIIYHRIRRLSRDNLAHPTAARKVPWCRYTPTARCYLPHVECECLTLVVGVNLFRLSILLDGERVERATVVVEVVDIGDCPSLIVEAYPAEVRGIW